MSCSRGTLRFCFPAHGDAVLRKMNALREERRFCDVTLLLGGPRGTTERLFLFHGHRVVLAASSDFLRDQFLLHAGRAELSVCAVSQVEVGERLLLSCYTGLLEFPLRDLLSYITAASALQMTQVVEKCAYTISQYLSPTLAVLKLEEHSEEEEIQEPDSSWLGTSSTTQEETDGTGCSNSAPAASTEEKQTGAALKTGQRGKSQGLKSMQEQRKDISEISGDTVAPSFEVHDVATEPHPTAALSDHISSVKSAHTELVDNWRDRGEKALEEHEEEDEKLPPDSNPLCLSGAHLPQPAEGPSAPRPYLCRRCDRVFQHLQSYVGHLREHRQHLCLVCEETFSQRSNLARHVRVHAGAKSFRCPLCHKTFSQKATLQDHLNVHTGEWPHRCHHCALHFPHKPGLRRHLKVTHGTDGLQHDTEEAVA